MSYKHIQEEKFFLCKKCGECCKGYGGTFVTDQDIECIAQFTGKDVETIINQYCDLSGNRRVLTQQPNGYCIFWDKICTIHPVKPTMCKNWPFIQSLKIDIHNWHIMAGSCPGMKTDISLDQLEAYIKDRSC